MFGIQTAIMAGIVAVTMTVTAGILYQRQYAAMLDQVKVGDKIRFAVEKVGGALTVTALEAAQ